MILQTVKTLFNKILKEEMKNRIRARFQNIFLYLDKIIIYKGYMKANKYIIKKKIFAYAEGNYGYRYDDFFYQIKSEYIKSKLIYEDWNTQDNDLLKCIEYIKANGIYDSYCGRLRVKNYSQNDIGYDEKNELFFGIYEGKKMYFSKEFDTTEKALEYLNGISAEQNEHSPHQYLTPEFNVGSEDIVFDIGCAEGNFALSVVERVKEIYLFEVEEPWIKPLKLTFAPYMDKVHIINKYVGRCSEGLTVTIDDFCRKNHIKQVGFIKLDVEGYEGDVLLGGTNMIAENRIKKIAVCTYHRFHDEKKLKAMLSKYEIVMSEGYMLSLEVRICNIDELNSANSALFTKGLIRATLNETCIKGVGII